MNFSQDDSLLATASGDQTARVVDMATQTTVAVLAQHSASLKQVRFQPGAANNSVLASSSRDGSVQIWDLRCTGAQGPAQRIQIPLDPALITDTYRPQDVKYGYPVNSIYDAHRPTLQGRLSQHLAPRDGASRGEVPGRIGDVSITAISFLPEGQEHILMTASEANATIKLWDIRSLHNARRKTTIPISCTEQPQSHSQWRHFGINSLSVNGDGSRLYALCKDNTVYAYSTAHLVLGQAPELSAGSTWKRHKGTETQKGLGPLYGFRHKQLHATSFYVKAALRPPRNGNSEMLAVGSCDGCAVLFPTDEKYLEVTRESVEPDSASDQHRIRRARSGLGSGSQVNYDNIRISGNGTPLIRGHDQEVSALSWTSNGELVTMGDDFLVRCWREGKEARDLRVGGEQEGRRWGCGWADVPAAFDDDDE
jgi:WD40 repeat protein